MRLSLFVVDFHLEESTLDPGAVERLPSLPDLDALLRQSRALPSYADWRAALLSEIGIADSPGLSVARVAARVAGLPSDAVPWLAQPVHRVAGLSSVNLHPAGLLRLSGSEASDWCTDFNRDFAAAGLRLHALPPGLLLTGLAPGARGAADPARFLGAPLPAALPAAGQQIEAEKSLRRASAEIEMWLHEHPRNRLRERRGELAVNGLWLWGGAGSDLAATAPAVLPEAFGDDPFLRGAWQSFGAVAQDAGRFADLPVASSRAIVVRSAAMQSPRDSPLQRLEEDWFAPLRAARDLRQVQSLRLWFGGRGWEVHASTLFGRIWRRPRPWWQQVAA